jgi:hypothetical protein
MASHELCEKIAYERVDRESQRLEKMQRGLLVEAKAFGAAMNPNPQVSRALACRIASYYRQLGVTERAVEALAHGL